MTTASKTTAEHLSSGAIFRHDFTRRRVVVTSVRPADGFILVAYRGLMAPGTDRERLSSNEYNWRMAPDREVEVLGQFTPRTAR